MFPLGQREGRDGMLARVVQAPGKMAVPFLDSY